MQRIDRLTDKRMQKLLAIVEKVYSNRETLEDKQSYGHREHKTNPKYGKESPSSYSWVPRQKEMPAETPGERSRNGTPRPPPKAS